VSARVFELISFGVEPGDAVAQVHREFGGLTAGCNRAHRAAPLAMCSFIADDDLPATAVQEAKLTHEHGLAGDVSAAVVVLCRALIRGAAWSESPGSRRGRSATRDPSSHVACNQASAEVWWICSGRAARRHLFCRSAFLIRGRAFRSLAIRWSGELLSGPGGLNRRRTVGCFRDCYRRLSKERDFEASA
jgi:hypothetical protein